jgi:putative peptidoglycan lipid II flippase
MGTATLLFRFFAIQVVFYGASSILSGILNANRDYIWGAIAPVFNNIIVIATFLAYAAIAPINETLAIYVIAIGNPLGVFVQLAIQIPGAKRAGIKLRPYLDLKDPALRETASIGLPAIIVTICSFVTVSVANAASYAFADNGPSVIAYSRLWFTFPYSFLAIPVATTMFTELSAWQTDRQSAKVVKGIGEGAAQITFLMVPMAMLLIVFSVPLVTLYHVGAFSDEAITQIARYLVIMALALPFYGVNTHLQMAFSAIRRMGVFSIITLIGSAAQVAVIAISVAGISAGAPTSIEWIAAATVVAYLIEDVLAYIYLARAYSQGGSLYDAALKAESAHARTHAHAHTHTRNSAAGQFALSGIVVPTIKAFARSLVLGGLGALVGWALLSALQAFIAPIEASLLRSLIYTIVAGGVALVVTFGLAIKLDLPEALFVTNIWKKVKKVLSRKSN